MASQLIKEIEMAKYRVSLLRVDSFVMDVEADNEEDAVEKAMDETPGLCAQDGGWGRPWGVDEGEWMMLEDYYGTDYSEKRHGKSAEQVDD
jgi:hypothetical protein